MHENLCFTAFTGSNNSGIPEFYDQFQRQACHPSIVEGIKYCPDKVAWQRYFPGKTSPPVFVSSPQI